MNQDKNMGAPIEIVVEGDPPEARCDGHRLLSFSAELGEAYAAGEGDGLLIWPLTDEQVGMLLRLAPALLRANEAAELAGAERVVRGAFDAAGSTKGGES